MEFKRLTHYVENSYEGKPSFIIEFTNGSSYISSGSVFIENTYDNREWLIAIYDCERHLEELLESPGDLSEVTDGSYMFYGCETLDPFDEEMPRLTRTKDMFLGCEQYTI